TAAVVRRAEVRATLDDLAGNSNLRLARIVAALDACAARIFWDATRLRRIRVVLLRVPVRGPFPYIADHVLHVVAVRRECGDRRCAREAVFIAVLEREIALPSVRH